MTKVLMLFVILNTNGDVIYNESKPFILDYETCLEAIPGTKSYLESYARVYQNEVIHVELSCISR
jgi:hypothetical protein